MMSVYIDKQIDWNAGSCTLVRRATTDGSVVDRTLQRETISRRFKSRNKPIISIHAYLCRINQYCPLSPAAIIIALDYLHRIAFPKPHVLMYKNKSTPESMTGLGLQNSHFLTMFSVHRYILASLRIASKFIEDIVPSHRRFAKVAGISNQELLKLEVSLLYLLDFEIWVRKETISNRLRQLTVEYYNLSDESTHNCNDILEQSLAKATLNCSHEESSESVGAA